jgi:hypothetical protein
VVWCRPTAVPHRPAARSVPLTSPRCCWSPCTHRLTGKQSITWVDDSLDGVEPNRLVVAFGERRDPPHPSLRQSDSSWSTPDVHTGSHTGSGHCATIVPSLLGGGQADHGRV